MRNQLLVASLIVTASISFAADRVTLTGRVTDNLGQPLENATVMVYHAGVKTGYSTYCPGCFRDCGKRTVTDRTGSFTIKNLDSDLWFELLVVRDGYTAGFVERVDPLPMDQLKRRSLRHEPLLMISVASSVAEWWINTADRCVRRSGAGRSRHGVAGPSSEYVWDDKRPRTHRGHQRKRAV